MQNDLLDATMGIELLNACVSRSSNSWSDDPLQRRSTEITSGCIALFYFPFNGVHLHANYEKSATNNETPEIIHRFSTKETFSMFI